MTSVRPAIGLCVVDSCKGHVAKGHCLARPCNNSLCYCQRSFWHGCRKRCRRCWHSTPGCIAISRSRVYDTRDGEGNSRNRYCILLGREGDMGDSRYSPFVLGHSYRNCRALPYALRPSISKAYSASYVYFRSSSVWSSNLGPISMAANISKFRSMADIIPIPLPPWLVQILFAIIGALLMRGPKYEVSEFEENYQRLEHEREKERRVQKVFNEKARSMSA